MKYRIVTAGSGFYAQCRFKYWPFWSRVFDFGHNYFKTVEEAESAIKKIIGYSRTDGRVVKELDANGAEPTAGVQPTKPWPRSNGLEADAGGDAHD